MRPDSQTSPFGILGRALGAGPLGGLRRYFRWFNLTVLQQALWPLLIVVASAPQVDLEKTPTDWFILRLAGPLLAVIAALAYLRRPVPRAPASPVILSDAKDLLPQQFSTEPRSLAESALASSAYPSVREQLRGLVTPPANLRAPAIAKQVRYALLVLPVVIGVLRLIGWPFDEAARIILFGLINVAAYHLIHFGVVPASFDDRRQGYIAGAILFGCSWGLHNALMFGLTDGAWLPGLAAGCALGWFFGAGSLMIRRWPGGALTAAAVHFLVVYLVAGFA